MHIYFLWNFFTAIGEAIDQLFRSLTFLISSVLYEFIVSLYRVFLYISRANVLDSDYIQSIYNKVGLLLGLFMIFKLSFSLIQSLIDPDKFTDKKNGYTSIIYRSIISIVLLGITPTIFRMALDFQNVVVGSNDNTSNIIYKIIVADNSKYKASEFGRVLSSDLFFSFFRETSEGILDQGDKMILDENGKVVITEDDYDNIVAEVKEGRSFYSLRHYLKSRKGGEYVIDWDPIFSIVTALATIWILINYCIAVATRAIQLAYLQLIAPIPILSYISDPDGVFKRWTKQCLTTYLDLFMRMAIIYFIVTVVGFVMSYWDDPSKFGAGTGLSPDAPELKWVKIFLVLGLLMFGKRVPELLKELFPNSGGAASLGFGIKKPKDLVSSIPVVGGLGAKAIGYVDNKAKAGAKWLGKKAASPVTSAYGALWKRPHERRVEARKNRIEARHELGYQHSLENAGERLFNKYSHDGQFNVEDIAKSFSNDEFRQSYLALENSKAEAQRALREHGANSAEYINAQDKLNKAKQRHELMQKRYTSDAMREKEWNAYKRKIGQHIVDSSNNSGSNNVPITSDNSVLNNMSKKEWNHYRRASELNPNEYFSNMAKKYAEEASKRGGNVSSSFVKDWEQEYADMETAFERNGWTKDSSGKWSNSNNPDSDDSHSYNSDRHSEELARNVEARYKKAGFVKDEKGNWVRPNQLNDEVPWDDFGANE